MRTSQYHLPSGHRQLRRQLRAYSREVADKTWQKIIRELEGSPNATVTWDLFEAAVRESMSEVGQQRADEPQLDPEVARRAMDEYARGEWDSVQGILDDLRGSSS